MHDLIAVAVEDLLGARLVHVTTTEAEAKLWLEENPTAWDVAIVDLILDQGSGFGVLSKAAAISPGGRVVVFSSFVTLGIREHCLRAGAQAVFQKDEPEAFVRWLDRLSST